MRLTVSKSSLSAGKCARESCELPFKKGTIMVGVEHGFGQINWRHQECIGHVELQVMGEPELSVDFEGLNVKVQNAVLEWYKEAIKPLEKDNEFQNMDDSVRKVAKVGCDEDKSVRVIKSQNSLASAIGSLGSMLGMGFGNSDSVFQYDISHESEGEDSVEIADEKVVDSLSEQSNDESFHGSMQN